MFSDNSISSFDPTHWFPRTTEAIRTVGKSGKRLRVQQILGNMRRVLFIRTRDKQLPISRYLECDRITPTMQTFRFIGRGLRSFDAKRAFVASFVIRIAISDCIALRREDHRFSCKIVFPRDYLPRSRLRLVIRDTGIVSKRSGLRNWNETRGCSNVSRVSSRTTLDFAPRI